MKDFLKFVKKHRERILAGSILVLSVAIVGLSLAYLIADKMVPGAVFFLAALLMITLAMNYSRQKKKSKGVFVFYAVTAVVCVIAGLIQMFVPME